MSDDLRTAVTRAILVHMKYDNAADSWRYSVDNHGIDRLADAALAVATPIIRAQVIEELAREVEQENWIWGQETVANWLRARKEDEGD